MGPDLLTVEEMGRADALAVKHGVPSLDLMEAAGEGIVREIRKRWTRRSVHVLAGPGNNGGDGFVVARLLQELRWPVRLALLGDKAKLKGDAKANADRWEGEVETFDGVSFDGVELIVDALFGAGLARDVDGVPAEALQNAQECGLPLVAVDVPSGVDGNTGEVRGIAPEADLTVTFFRMKPGHLLLPGRDLCGETVVRDIGIPEIVLEEVSPAVFENGPAVWGSLLPQVDTSSHKYTRGHLLIVGGGEMTGAARLAAGAARRAGAGMVSIAAPARALEVYKSSDPGNLVVELPEGGDLSILLVDERKNTVLVGPGGGVKQATRNAVISALKTKRPVVLDADALSVFEDDPETLFSWIKGPCILTPHEGEFRRLFENQRDRLSKCRNAAENSGAVVLLKGADTVIADPSGRAVINSNAPANLATAGSGDVLAGIIASLVAQGMPAFEAACAGAWMHGEAGQSAGPGLVAEDLANFLPDLS